MRVPVLPVSFVLDRGFSLLTGMPIGTLKIFTKLVSTMCTFARTMMPRRGESRATSRAYMPGSFGVKTTLPPHRLDDQYRRYIRPDVRS
jgi:hypothetical protein